MNGQISVVIRVDLFTFHPFSVIGRSYVASTNCMAIRVKLPRV